MSRSRLAGLVLFGAALAAYFAFDLGQRLTLEAFKWRQQAFQAYYAAHPALTIVQFAGMYVFATALSLPGAALLTLAGGGLRTIVGPAIVADHAGEMMAEYVLAMKHGIGLHKIFGTIHIYPTMAEANKYAAGEWKRAHAPQRLLALAERFHTWRRSA